MIKLQKTKSDHDWPGAKKSKPAIEFTSSSSLYFFSLNSTKQTKYRFIIILQAKIGSLFNQVDQV